MPAHITETIISKGDPKCKGDVNFTAVGPNTTKVTCDSCSLEYLTTVIHSHTEGAT